MSTYYLTKRSKVYALGWLFLFLFVFIGLFLYLFPGITLFAYYLLGLGILSIYFSIVQARNESIVVSENGIEFRSLGMIVETKWEDIEGISRYWYHGLPNECLVVDNSKARIRKWTFPARYPPSPFGFSSHITIFPLSSFADNWRDSDLGQQIKQYAPHLFETAGD